MRINEIKFAQNNLKFAFKSRRTDINSIEQLKNGTNPISENAKLNILKAIQNLSKTPDRANIEFLLDISEHLNYGQGTNTEFKAILDDEGITPEDRENTNWQEILNNVISMALDSSEDNVEDLKRRFKRYTDDDYKHPLTSEQKDVLSLRSHITAVLAKETENADGDDIIRIANIRKNLDYFIASSETSIVQKKECLEKFKYFLSDEYKIHPQLEDKKLQVLDEMLSDIVIKTPEDDVLTIKSVDQLHSGICAAISICRKALAYEDKTRYVDIILDELKDSPTMEVFDVTELGTGKKIEIEKADINYDAALSRGYRIIDASAHIWMQNAHASGDGSILTERYTAFDDDYYGIYDDSSWYEGLGETLTPAKAFLKALIKENSEIEALEKKRKEIKNLQSGIEQSKNKWLKEQGKLGAKLDDALKYVFPEKPFIQIRELRRDLIKYYNGTNSSNEINVSEKLPKEIKKERLEEFIEKSDENMTEAQKTRLSEKLEIIYNMTDEYSLTDKKFANAKKYSSPAGKLRYYKNLFRIAAAHRSAVEADVNMPDGVMRYEKMLNIQPQATRAVKYLHSLEPKLSSKEFREQFAGQFGLENSEDKMKNRLTRDIIQIESLIPLKLNSLIKELLNSDIKSLLIEMYEETLNEVKSGNKEIIYRAADIFEIKPEKDAILKRIKKSIDRLNSSKSINTYEVQEAIRELGYENIIEFSNAILGSYFTMLQTGISEEEYAKLQSKYGENEVVMPLTQKRNEYLKLRDQYNEILNRWQVPKSRDLIINAFERNQWILSTKKLDKLKERFDLIDTQIAENRKNIPNIKMRKKANAAAVKFQTDEIDLLNKIDSSVSAMRKFGKNSYKDITELLHDELEDQYSYIGRLNGQFWVREEGSSGLSSNEQVRIIEQMTGKPHHIETDVKKAAEYIKAGKGSGIMSSSVDDSDYAFHAQYIPMVTSESFTDPKTGKKRNEDVLWTDNSWGKVENEYYWTGANGKRYTDYGGGYGWRDGFILDKSFRIGQKVSDIDCAVGTAEGGKTKFGLFSDVILPGSSDRTYSKLYKLMQSIFEINDADAQLTDYEKELAQHPINPDNIDGLDDLIEMRMELLANRLEKINSQEEYDKLPDNDQLKLTMEKLVLYRLTHDDELRDIILSSQTLGELEEAKEELIGDNIDKISDIIGKSDRTLAMIMMYSKSKIMQLFEDIEDQFGEKKDEHIKDETLVKIFDVSMEEDSNWKGSLIQLEEILKQNAEENAKLLFDNEAAAEYFAKKAGEIISEIIYKDIKIKSVDDIKNSNSSFNKSPLAKEFTAAIDKYLKPKDDNELLKLIQGFQNGEFELSKKFMDVLTPEDLGLNFESGYDYIKKYKADDMSVVRDFSKIAGIDILYSTDLGDAGNIYREFRIKLIDMDVQKFVKGFKAEAFAKYKLRQAFPQPIVLSDKYIEEYVRSIFTSFSESVEKIINAEHTLLMMSKYKKFKNAASKSIVFSKLSEGKNVLLSEKNIKNYEKARISLNELYEQLKDDTSAENITTQIELLLKEVNNSNGLFDGSKIGKILNQIYQAFDELINADIIGKSRKNKMSAMQEISNNMSLFVNTGLDARYRNDAMQKMKNILNLLKKHASDEIIEDYLTDFVRFVQKNYITKNPAKLLNECTKDILAGKINTDEYKIKRMYLKKALKVANQTKIQYKLVQNQHEGFSSKIKDILPIFYVYDLIDSKQERADMTSDDGLIYLVQQLENADDNYTTLSLFMEQTGLARSAVIALINTFNLKKAKEETEKTVISINNTLDEAEELQKVIEKYFERSRIKYKSLEDACKHIADYVERRLKVNEDSKVIKPFLENMRNIKVADGSISVESPLFYEQLLPAIVLQIINDLMETAGNNYKMILSISDMIDERIGLLSKLNVPENSNEYKVREEFTAKVQELQTYIKDVIDTLNLRLQNDIYDVN